MNNDEYLKLRAEQDRQEAESTLTQIQAMKVLCGNNDLACEIHIAGMKMGVLENSLVIPALNHLEEHIKLFLEGRPNEWE